MNIVDQIVRLFETTGRTAYQGEAVSQAEHALQAAHLAEADGAADALVVAALVHDVGHLLDGRPDEEEAGPGGDADGRHEEAGGAWMAEHFSLEVVEPVRLHVAAKRYLCTVDPSYRAGLSPASVRSLAAQGGPFCEDEVAAFESHPHHLAAVRLRRWDDAAKVPGLAVPGLDHYRDRLAKSLALSNPTSREPGL